MNNIEVNQVWEKYGTRLIVSDIFQYAVRYYDCGRKEFAITTRNSFLSSAFLVE